MFDFARAFDVLVICLPVFGVVGVGKLLQHAGLFNEDRRQFANWLVYRIALPILVFRGVAQQRFASFWNPSLVLTPLVAIAVVAGVYILLARLCRYRQGMAAAFVFGTFWANVTYIGFPLSQSAFGDEGLALAAIYNAFVMPGFIALGFLLIGVYGAMPGHSRGARFRQILMNPVILGAAVGVVFSLVAEGWRADDGTLALPVVLGGAVRLADAFLKLLGEMGLPLALLTIGGSLHLGGVVHHRQALAMVVLAKLVLLPGLLYLLFLWFLPDAAPATRGICVLLTATPNAVASYVISREIGVEEGFVAAMLVVSTALSVITIPVWLYILL